MKVRIIRVLHAIDRFLYDVLVRYDSPFDHLSPEQILAWRVLWGNR